MKDSEGDFRGSVGRVAMWNRALETTELNSTFQNINAVSSGRTTTWGNFELYGGAERVYGVVPPAGSISAQIIRMCNTIERSKMKESYSA